MIAVQQHLVGLDTQLDQGPMTGESQRRHQAELVDLGRRSVPHAVRRGPSTDLRRQPLARLGRQQLAVPDALRCGARLFGHDDRADRDRSAQRATADLVGARQRREATVTQQATFDTQ